MAGVVDMTGALALCNSPISSSLKVPWFKLKWISSSPEAASNSLIEADVGERGGVKDGVKDGVKFRGHHEVLRIQLLQTYNLIQS